MDPLPIDRQLPAALAELDRAGALVLTAPPGAGKSTRLPPGLVPRVSGQTLLLQPRRVAARSLARRIADEQHWTLGREVGWRVRFDRMGGRETRLWVMTEGTLTRQLQGDPYLDGVGAVILDEFHERSLHTDLCLSWLAELRRTVRPDLRVVVMSATMDTAPVSAALGGCPVVAVEHPTYPVTTSHFPPNDRERIGDHVARAVTEALRNDDCGDILVFLPGTGEIRICQYTLGDLARQHDLAVLPLHGSLSPDDQDAALAPASRRKVVLATNVAETSLTIPGVRTVIDSGQVRVARFAADTGLDELRLEQIGRYSATQRAGRAGRTASGRCLRLWSRLTENRMVDSVEPEIARVDLAPTLLALKGWHGDDPRRFPWFQRPEDGRLAAGEELLAMLGAIAAPYGALTPLGKKLADIPAHPRLARLLFDAQRLGRATLGAALAALSDARDLRPPRSDAPAGRGACDAIDRLECLRRAEQARFRDGLRDEGIDPMAAREAAQIRDELLRAAKAEPTSADALPPDATTVARLLLAAYPDRVGKRSAPTANKGVLVGGIGVEIDRGSCLFAMPAQRRPELFLAPRVQDMAHGGRSSVMVRQGSELDEADITAVFPEAIQRRELLSFDQQRQTVTAIVGWYYRDLCLRAATGAQADPAAISACLRDALRADVRSVFTADEAVASWLARTAWLRNAMPDLALPDIDDAALIEVLGSLCDGCRSRADVVAKDKLSWLHARLSHDQQRAIETHAPAALTVPSGSSIRLQYDDAQRPPVLAVRLQELFGLRETPKLAGGRVPVLLHLLAPNYRPEQVTQDLASFWANTYPQVRKDLRARYPKHSWPDDPLTAVPVAKGRPRPAQ